MKKIKSIILGIFVIGILVTNLTIIGSKDNKWDISLSSIKNALAQPGVEIGPLKCSTGGQGRCHYSSGNSTMWCNGYWKNLHGCLYNGNLDSSCAIVKCD